MWPGYILHGIHSQCFVFSTGGGRGTEAGGLETKTKRKSIEIFPFIFPPCIQVFSYGAKKFLIARGNQSEFRACWFNFVSKAFNCNSSLFQLSFLSVKQGAYIYTDFILYSLIEVNVAVSFSEKSQWVGGTPRRPRGLSTYHKFSKDCLKQN